MFTRAWSVSLTAYQTRHLLPSRDQARTILSWRKGNRGLLIKQARGDDLSQLGYYEALGRCYGSGCDRPAPSAGSARAPIPERLDSNVHNRMCSRSGTGRLMHSAAGLLARRFGDCLHSLEGAEHVPLVPTLPQDAAQWPPYLGEKVVAQIE